MSRPAHTRARTLSRLVRTFASTAALLSCSDSHNPVAPEPTDTSLAHVRCVVSVATGAFACASPSTTGAAIALDGVVVGAQGTFVNLAATGATYDAAASLLRAQVTVQNLIAQAMGTTDGTTLDPHGVRVFFTSRPSVTGGHGSVTVHNADGSDTFTDANQAYFQYSQILPPNATSSPREWQFSVPSSVTAFQFDVLVAASVVHPAGFITVTPPSGTLRSGASLQLSGNVRDVLGRAVTDATIAWSTGNAAVATVSSTGVVTGAGSGTTTITATAGSRTGTAAITVVTPSATTSTLAATPTALVAGQTSALTVQVKDAGGQNLAGGGDLVTIASTLGAVTVVTDAGDGTYHATLSSTSAGTAQVSATLNGAAIPGPIAVVFSAATATTIAKNSADPQTAVAGAAVAAAPSVIIKDQFGNPVAGVAVTFAVASGAGAVTGGVQTTSAAGIATTGGWTLGTAAGSNTLTATAGALSVTFTATATAGAPAIMTKQAGDGQVALAGSAVATAPSVLVKDASGNPVAGVTVAFAPAPGSGTVTGGTQTTNALGLATVGSWTLGNTAGSNSLLVSSASTSVVFTATGTAGGPALIFAVAGTGQSAPAGGTVAIPPAVQVTDAVGNPISGVPVTFAATAGGGSVTGAVQSTNAAGIATVGSWTLGTVVGTNNNSLTATAGALSTAITASVTSGPLNHFLVEASGGGVIGTQTAGTPFAIRITAQDASNNTVTGFTGTANITSNRAGSAGLTTTAAFVGGVLASHSITLTAAGAGATLTATRTGGAETGTSSAFVVNPGALNHFLVEASGGGAIGAQTAGTPFTVQITAQDAGNNTVTGFTGTVNVTSNRTGSAGLITTAAFTAGVLASHSVTLTQSGAASTLTATRTGGAETGVSNAFTVNAGALTHFLVEASGGGPIAGQLAGTPFTIRITAQDANNNVAAGFVGTADITSNVAGSAGLVTTAAFTAGVLAGHSVTLTQTSANATLTATHTGGAETGTSNTFAIGAGALTHFLVEASGGGALGPQTAGTPFTLRITAQDAGNNTVTGFTGTVDVTSNRIGTAGLVTSAAFAGGVLLSHSVTLTQAGAGATITATRSGGAETGTSAAFTVNAGVLHHFVVEASAGGPISAQTAGTPFTIRITAQDISNNTATSFTGTVDVTSNRTGSAGLATSAAFTAGVLASHSITLTQAGAGATVTATRTGGAEAGTSTAFAVNAGALTHFVVEAAGGGAIATQAAAVPFSVQITAQDASNNTVTSFAGTADVTSNRTGSAGLTTTAAFTAGVLASHSIALTQPGALSSITATRTGGAEAGTSNTFTVNPGALNHFLVEAQGGGAIGGQASNIAFNIRVTAQDVVDNTVTSFAGTVDITSTGTLSAGSGTTAAFVAGVLASRSVTISNAGTFTITATRTAGAETGTSNSFAVVNAPMVTTTTPVDAATGIATSSTIVVNFNRTVNATTSSFVVKCPASGAPMPYTLSASPATSFTLTPTGGWAGGEICQVTVVAAQVTDLSAIAMSTDVVFSFTTILSSSNDTYPQNVIGNVSVNSATAPFSVTTNDGVGATAVVTFAGWIATPGATENGGTMSMITSGANRGQFTYDPPTGFTGTDHFTYTISSGVATSTATVTMTVANMVWFIDNTGACSLSCDGRLSHPFTSLAAFQAVNNGTALHPAAGHSIFLRESGTSYAGPVTLLTNQKLIGQDATVSLSTVTGIAVPSGSVPFPVMAPGNGTHSTIAGASGGVVLASGASAFIHGLTIATTGGTAIASGGAAFGTLTFADGGSELADVSIAATGGGAFALSNGTMSGALSATSSTGGVNNVQLQSVATSGTFDFGGGALSGATVTAFQVTAGAGSFIYSGNVTTAAATAVAVASKNGGAVTFAGTISATNAAPAISVTNNTVTAIIFSGSAKTLSGSAGVGVTVSGNTGSAINFVNGGLAITTTSGDGFDASNGGIVIVSGTGNTIASTTGTALNVQNTTSGGLAFQSISAAGGANGIVLINGGPGGLTVTGTGGACSRSTPTCTGGVIGSTNGADGATAGNGIYITNTSSISLTGMRINGTHQNFGLHGSSVTGLTLANMLMDGTYGTSVASNEGAVGFDELAGGASVTNSYFAGGVSNNFRIHNAAAGTALSRITFDTDTLGFTNTGAASNDAVQVLADAGTTNVTVQNSSFLGAGQNNMEFLVNGGTADLAFNNNLLVDGQSNTSSTFIHLALVADGVNATTGNITYAIGNNNFTGSKQAAIYIPKRHGQWVMTGQITGNTIGATGTANSGSLNGEGIRVEWVSQGKHKLLISNNHISQVNNIAMVSARFLSNGTGAPSNGSMHLTLTSNTFSNPGNNGDYLDAIHFDPASATGDTYTMCLNVGIGGSNSLAGGVRDGSFPGAPYSIGPVTPSTNNGFLKILGLAGGPFTGNAATTAIDNLFTANNSAGAALSFIDLGTALITSTSTAAAGVACDLF